MVSSKYTVMVEGNKTDIVIRLNLSCQETWVRVRGRGCHFLKKGAWVRRVYCIYLYICVCVCVIVTSYMHIDFFINYES